MAGKNRVFFRALPQKVPFRAVTLSAPEADEGSGRAGAIGTGLALLVSKALLHQILVSYYLEPAHWCQGVTDR